MSKNDNPRAWLRQSLQAHLVPALVEIGFQQGGLPGIFANDRAAKRRHPFGMFRRVREGGTDLLTIHLEKYDRPRFSIEFGTAPPGALHHASGPPIDHADIWVNWLPKPFGLYHSTFFLTPFAVRRWPWSRALTPGDFDQLAQRVTAMVPEIERALRGDPSGRHVHRAF